MTMPFAETRFERERLHLFYLPTSVRERIEIAKPVYLIGARGTGKTTLLQSLHWDERGGNVQLREQLTPGEPFATLYGQLFGVYLKVSEHAFASVELWAAQMDDAQANQIRGSYLEILWAEVLVRALANALAKRFLDAPPTTEYAVVDRLREDWEHSWRRLSQLRPSTLGEMARALRFVRQDFEAAALRRQTIEEVVDRIGDLTHPGEFLAYVANSTTDLLRESTTSEWYIKLCVDEAETISAGFKRTINGFVRNAKWPLFYVVSYAQLPDELLDTQIAEIGVLPTVDADIIRLDAQSDLAEELGVTFREYVEGVANTRIRYVRSKEDSSDRAASFSLRTFVGRSAVNTILLRKLGHGSVSRDARELVDRARELAAHPFFKAYRSRDEAEEDESVPPIYQTFLIETLNIELPTEKAERWERRGQEAAELRSRVVAAYMAICDRFNIEIEYSSEDVVLALSDGCIRDFLSFSHEMCVQADASLSQIDTVTISPRTQSKAIVAVTAVRLISDWDRACDCANAT